MYFVLSLHFTKYREHFEKPVYLNSADKTKSVYTKIEIAKLEHYNDVNVTSLVSAV